MIVSKILNNYDDVEKTVKQLLKLKITVEKSQNSKSKVFIIT